jgi:hypothetical protein
MTDLLSSWQAGFSSGPGSFPDGPPSPWPAAELIFLRSEQRVPLILLRGGGGWTRHSF